MHRECDVRKMHLNALHVLFDNLMLGKDSKLKIFEIRNFREWEETLRKICKSKIQKATTLVIMCVSKCDLNIIFKIMFKLMLLLSPSFWQILANFCKEGVRTAGQTGQKLSCGISLL